MATLDDALDLYKVEQINERFGFKYIVTGPDGILGGFNDETVACRFRLAEVNRYLND